MTTIHDFIRDSIHEWITSLGFTAEKECGEIGRFDVLVYKKVNDTTIPVLAIEVESNYSLSDIFSDIGKKTVNNVPYMIIFTVGETGRGAKKIEDNCLIIPCRGSYNFIKTITDFPINNAEILKFYGSLEAIVTNSDRIEEEFTTIQIPKTLRDAMKGLKLSKRESYSEIIGRLIKFYKEANEKGTEGQVGGV